jgi:hypothetical protein
LPLQRAADRIRHHWFVRSSDDPLDKSNLRIARTTILTKVKCDGTSRKNCRRVRPLRNLDRHSVLRVRAGAVLNIRARAAMAFLWQKGDNDDEAKFKSAVAHGANEFSTSRQCSAPHH